MIIGHKPPQAVKTPSRWDKLWRVLFYIGLAGWVTIIILGIGVAVDKLGPVEWLFFPAGSVTTGITIAVFVRAVRRYYRK